MIRDIDIGHLRTFLAVSEHRNMTSAANLRGLTQSAVSQQIKRLEECLDTRVMIRSPGGVSLTRSGKKLLPQARALVRANDEMLGHMMETKIDPDVRLGVPQDVVSSLLPDVLANFHKAYPDTNVTLVSASSRELIEMLKDGDIDLALTTDRSHDPDADILFRKPLVWIGAIGGSAHLKTPLPVAVGHENCPFRQAASSTLSTHSIPWRAVTQVGSLEPVFATLIADIAVAPFLPGTLPGRTAEITRSMPELPEFFLHLRCPDKGVTPSTCALYDAIKLELGKPEDPVS